MSNVILFLIWVFDFDSAFDVVWLTTWTRLIVVLGSHKAADNNVELGWENVFFIEMRIIL